MYTYPTPTEWMNKVGTHVPWQDAYHFVEEQVKAMIRDGLKPGDTLSTTEVVYQLWPCAAENDEQVAARRRIFSALNVLKKHGLRDWHITGKPEVNKYGQIIRRSRWRLPAVCQEPEPVVESKAPVVPSNQEFLDMVLLQDAAKTVTQAILGHGTREDLAALLHKINRRLETSTANRSQS